MRSEPDISTRFSIETFFIILVVVGYVFASGLAIPLGVQDSRMFAVPYRFLVAALSIFFIVKNFSLKKMLSLPVVVTVVFWAFYFLKSYYSYQNDVYDAEFLRQENEIYVRIVLIALLPAISLMMLDYEKVNLAETVKWIFWVLLIFLLINTVYGLFHIRRGKLTHIFSVYYISYGHFGTSLSLISFYLLNFHTNTQRKKLLYLFSFLFGLFIIIEGFARSPFLALVIGLIFLLVLKRSIKSLIWLALAVAALLTVIYFTVSTGVNKLLFFERTYKWIFLGDNSLRTPLFRRGLSIFAEHPIFGGRVLYENGMYPHNIFIELLMATGMVGCALYFLRFVPVFQTGNYFFRSTQGNFQVVLFTLFLQYFILVLTSYPVYSTPEFLHLSAIIIGLSIIFKNGKIKSNDGGRHPSGDYSAFEGTGGFG